VQVAHIARTITIVVSGAACTPINVTRMQRAVFGIDGRGRSAK
jgi:hypothetical protein